MSVVKLWRINSMKTEKAKSFEKDLIILLILYSVITNIYFYMEGYITIIGLIIYYAILTEGVKIAIKEGEKIRVEMPN